LERRWGKISPQVEQPLQALNSRQLELLAEALLDFQSQALTCWAKAEEAEEGGYCASALGYAATL